MTDATMTAKEFGQALGIVTQAWKDGHQDHVATVLKVVATVFETLDAPQLEVSRVVGPDKGEGHWYRQEWITTGASK
jgi:hypothetical protein